MATDTKQAEETPENDTQESPMPSEEQKTVTDTPADESSPVKEEPKSEEQTDQDLPEGASERTRTQFDKLREQLREEKARRAYYENVFQSIQTKPDKPQPAEVPIYDPDTGLINADALTALQKQTNEAQARADRAEQAVQNYLKEQENRETYAAFPELDPNKKKTFDKTLHIETRSILFDSMLNPQDYNNKQLSFKEAAQLAKDRLSKGLESAKKQGAQEALDELTPKEQASLSAVGSPSRRREVEGDLSQLRRATQKGDKAASISRMKSILGEE